MRAAVDRLHLAVAGLLRAMANGLDPDPLDADSAYRLGYWRGYHDARLGEAFDEKPAWADLP